MILLVAMVSLIVRFPITKGPTHYEVLARVTISIIRSAVA